MTLNIYLTVADFVRPEADKTKLVVAGINARYTLADSPSLPGKWSFLVAEIEVPDRIGLDVTGESVVVTPEIGGDDSTVMLPGDVQILGSWLNENRKLMALRYIPTKNLVSHAERKHFGFTLIRRHGYGFGE